MGIVVIDSSKIYPKSSFINTAVGEKCSLPLRGWCNRLCHYFKMYLQSWRNPWFKHCLVLRSVSVMYVCIWSPCPCSWLDRTLGLCPFWCSVTAGMGWGSQTWQQAKWVGGLLLLYWATPLHLCICSPSPQTNHAKGNGTRQQQRTVLDIKILTGNLKRWNKKDYFCQNVSWDILQQKKYFYFETLDLKNVTVFMYAVSGNNLLILLLTSIDALLLKLAYMIRWRLVGWGWGAQMVTLNFSIQNKI